MYKAASFTLCTFLLLASHVYSETSLPELRVKFPTQLIHKDTAGYPVDQPPQGKFEIIAYQTELGDFPAYVSVPSDKAVKHPAIIWLVGGFSNSISDIAWAEPSPENDQSASVFWQNGVVVMYPSLRGGNQNAGYIENCYGEADDVIAAVAYLKTLDYVDSERIYLGGHSTGGTLALLVASSTDAFKAVYALGPVEAVSRYGQESLNYDVDDFRESAYRAPVRWLSRITVPTYVFEGTEGNYDSLIELQSKNKNPEIHFYAIRNHDHFNVIYPVSELIAQKIMDDDGVITKKDIMATFSDAPSE